MQVTTFVGLDIGSEAHVLAAVDARGDVTQRPTRCTEDAEGYARLDAALTQAGTPEATLVVCEATGHYWQNVVAHLWAGGWRVALVNPLRTARYAGEELARTKTDALDAVLLARFGREKQPAPTPVTDEATRELTELARLRARLMQDVQERVNQLHRVVDLTFPEFTQHVKTLDSDLALAILARYPSARALAQVTPRKLAGLVYAGRRRVGDDLARALVAAAAASVGAHHTDAYARQARYGGRSPAEDLTTLHARLRDLDGELRTRVEEHDIGRHPHGAPVLTIPGIGPITAVSVAM